MYARLYRNACRRDKHGIEVLGMPIREVEAEMLMGCPICDGSGWTFEADPYGEEFYPAPCPLGGQFPTLHTDGRTM